MTNAPLQCKGMCIAAVLVVTLHSPVHPLQSLTSAGFVLPTRHHISLMTFSMSIEELLANSKCKRLPKKLVAFRDRLVMYAYAKRDLAISLLTCCFARSPARKEGRECRSSVCTFIEVESPFDFARPCRVQLCIGSCPNCSLGLLSDKLCTTYLRVRHGQTP